MDKLNTNSEAMRALDEAELDAVHGGKITEQQINNGGQEPQGQANGVPTVNVNPSGYAPPGQN